MKKLLTILLILPLFCNAGPFLSSAGIFYASPTGTGIGTFASPFGLQTALSQPSSVHPGDTIYLLAGTYTGIFTSSLTGTITSPIILKNNPGDRVIIDGTRAGQAIKNLAALTINGAYTWYMGLEVTNSDTSVRSTTSTTQTTETRGIAVDVYGVGVKVINCIIYDCGQGLDAWIPATNSEYYGNIIFNNGWQMPNGGTGHGIYTQNNTGVKSYVDNVILNNFGNGWQVYGSGTAQLNNFYFEGNVCFNDRWLMGGIGPVHSIELNRNFAYNTSPEFGYVSHANDGLILRNNFFPLSMYLYWWKNVTADSNTIFYGKLPSAAIQLHFDSSVNAPPDLSTYHFDNNTYYFPVGSTSANQPITYWQNRQVTGNGIFYLSGWQGKGQDIHPNIQYYAKSGNNLVLTGKKVFIRTNKYDPNRFTVIIYNWDKSTTVNVGSILNTGDQYELHNVQNYFGDVVTGTYTDSLIVPMTGHTVAKPIGWPNEIAPTTFPEFGVFELIRKPALAVNQCHNIDSLINLVSIMQGQMIGLQMSVDSAMSRISALDGQISTITALQAALAALQTKVSNLKAITTIQ